MTATFQSAADLLPAWRDEVLSGTPPINYPIGTGELSRIEIGPQLVTLIGRAPVTGKIAFTIQAVIGALRMTSSLQAVVRNVEATPTCRSIASSLDSAALT